MESTNSDRSITGANVKKALHTLIGQTQATFETVFISEFDVRMGVPQKKSNQFGTDAILIFDDAIWIIKCTNSYRSDRIKGNEFDIEHIKRILHLKNTSKSIYAYFVLPDTLSKNDNNSIGKLRNSVLKKEIVTYFDDVFLMSELKMKIEEKCSNLITQGIRANKLGDIGEESIVKAFTNENNIKKWNKSPESHTLASSNYRLFEEILLQVLPPTDKIKEVSSVTTGIRQFKGTDFYDIDLNHLATNGKPKTDVSILITTDSNKQYRLNISVKRPNNVTTKRITVHEGSVKKLIADLSKSIPSNSIFQNSIEFERLRTALLDFQKAGNKKSMTESNKNYLDHNLPYLNPWLINYFIFGVNNSQFTNQIQFANLLVTINPSTGSSNVQTPTDVLAALSKFKTTFGTPFSWTYPSGKRGKSIQIKCPIQFD
ncbi:hypothetical protein EFR28_04240 [Latilactobacillus curvatus]|uniref:MspI family type II restriction endonuclease n=1 Tax=Latilactobacillus curvatus TaxID=28038 RepID=UPI000976FB14|nr:MspI family type II restriction endonuclease [Latilactobacillus curvatus]MCT3525215.1 hypothetical protein [Latilactobacillus curvatus]UTB69714.1 hypothetical protein A4W71_00435 [Latilactobacillus curvatus]UTB75056.1 hypothetical protein A4W73_09665 [Latilactobacillus curvatus]UTY80823.1 hypothetical protein A4W76_09665 [Latilactobacillus curvatus]